ncbi:TRAP transporter small permease [Halodesulfovibrio marinisediminis]|uniref:TRAP-type C4-dicarboxylate transport system, small permease component n=1 Tax=Halodesulfovibrio marinisediminis DSM 17456 TaxID=1121457 RepID=A0A1N6GTF4_9BACT|nr:TRAP transporter small permease [Halodesulfovibrio marinisediminis]SIO10762.1 TRAP-type C4-dicarboxylate transport system, small permease component [Halodesulfovibrio marinisediminis DSM 17456]
MEKQFRYGLTILLSSVAILQFVQVIWRYILQAPLMGLDDILIYPTLWLYLLGSVNASREDTQIKANVLDVFLKTDRSRLIVRIIADVMTVIVSAWLTSWAWGYFRYAFRVWKETPTIYLPTFYAECSLFIGLLFMTLFGLYHLAKNIRRFTLLSTKPVTTGLQSASEGSA